MMKTAIARFYELTICTAIEFFIFIMVGIRSLLGPAHCRYQVSCTLFAIEQLRTEKFLKALWTSSKRLASCNPLASFMKNK